MKPRPLLLCLAAAVIVGTLTGCGSTSAYKGPSLKFGIGYEGVELSVTLITKTATPSLTDAGTAFNALLPAGGCGGKTPVVP